MDAILPYQVALYGNPHSRTHSYGWESEEAVEKARKVIIVNIIINFYLIKLGVVYVASRKFNWS